MEDFVVKVILVGATGVGKTSFITRYCDKTIPDDFHAATVGVDLKVSTHDVEGKKIKCHIWDTAGQDNFETIVTTYFKGVGGVVAVFDVTCPSTLQNAEQWIKKVELQNSATVLPIMLLANKIDKKHNISTIAEAKKLSDKIGWIYKEVSAKNNLNIDNSFDSLIGEIYYKVIKKNIESPGIKIAGNNENIRLRSRDCSNSSGLFKCCQVF
tara:strand:- start:215 stop:847 length:633 start_codon:yes stop_codon:yes gene_type:complete